MSNVYSTEGNFESHLKVNPVMAFSFRVGQSSPYMRLPDAKGLEKSLIMQEGIAILNQDRPLFSTI